MFPLVMNRFVNAGTTRAKHAILTIHDHYLPGRGLLKMNPSSDWIAGL